LIPRQMKGGPSTDREKHDQLHPGWPCQGGEKTAFCSLFE
jgi:hypothetical protein